MSVAKSTLSDDVHHSMLPPWGLYFFKFPVPFPHHPHFCECVNHDDAMPRMVTCDAFDSTQKESTTPKGVAFRLTSSTQGSLLSSATLGYRKYNPDGVAVLLSIHHHTTTCDIITPPDGVAHIIAYLSQPQPRG